MPGQRPELFFVRAEELHVHCRPACWTGKMMTQNHWK